MASTIGLKPKLKRSSKARTATSSSPGKKKRKKPKKFNLDTKLRAALRQIWLRSPMRYAVLKAARVKPAHGRCAQCQEVFREEDLRVDHIVECGSIKGDLQGFADRLFCPPEGMRAVCKPCHSDLTYMQRLAKRNRFEA